MLLSRHYCCGDGKQNPNTTLLSHKECIRRASHTFPELEGGYVKGGKLGGGSYGLVYELALPLPPLHLRRKMSSSTKPTVQKPKLALKMVRKSYNEAIYEIAVSKMLWDALGIGPRFVAAWVCNCIDEEGAHGGDTFTHIPNDVVMMVQECWDGTCDKLFNFFDISLEHTITEQLQRMHCIGWTHNDVKPTNLLYRKIATTMEDGSVVDKYEYTLCDFGRAYCFDPQLFQSSGFQSRLLPLVLPDQALGPFFTPPGFLRVGLTYFFDMDSKRRDDFIKDTLAMLKTYTRREPSHRQGLADFVHLLQSTPSLCAQPQLYDYWYMMFRLNERYNHNYKGQTPLLQWLEEQVTEVTNFRATLEAVLTSHLNKRQRT